MRAVVVGTGAVGARAARQLLSFELLSEVVIVDADENRAAAVASVLQGESTAVNAGDAGSIRRDDVVVLAAPGDQARLARLALERGAHVVSIDDDVNVVRSLLDLDAEARERRRHVVVGAGFSPGLACVLAARAAAGFDQVEEIHVARVGTGGPACARQHHRALGARSIDWRDGRWEHRRGGSGRQLCWFPDPIRGVDCYAAASAEALLLVPAFGGVERVTARVAANRRDRMTGRLPMLRRPHPEGGIGAIRVEVRGTRGPARDERVLGAVDRPAVAAAAVCAVAARWVLEGRLSQHGAGGLASLAEPIPFLAALADRGVKAAAFEGAADAAS